MANTFIRHPIDHADLNVWGPKNTAVLESVTGICTAFLYLSGGTMYISTGKIGIVDTPSGTNGIGVVNISAAESIAHAGTNGIWKRVYMTVSGSTASFAIADMAGETSADVLPDTLFNAYVPAKGGYYVNNNARDIGAVWVDAGGNALYVITDKKTLNSASVIYAKDGSGLLLTDDAGNLGLCVEDGGNVGVKTRDPSAAFSVNGGINLPAATTEYRAITLGFGRSGDASTDINFISDATYTTYGLRIHRDNTGANSVSQILHRGTGALSLYTFEAANITFLTAGTNRFTISGSGDVAGFGGYAGGANRDFSLYWASDSYDWWDESDSERNFNIIGAEEFCIGTDYVGGGGKAGGSNRDFYIYLATDAFIKWVEASSVISLNSPNTSLVFTSGVFYYTGVGGAGSYNIGDGTNYFNDVSAKTFTDRSALWIENPDDAYNIIKNAKNEDVTGFCKKVESRGQNRLKYSDFPSYCWDDALQDPDEDIIYDDSFIIDEDSFNKQNREKPTFKKDDIIIKKNEKTRIRVVKEIIDNEEKNVIKLAAEGFDLSSGISVLMGAVQKLIQENEDLKMRVSTLEGN